MGRNAVTKIVSIYTYVYVCVRVWVYVCMCVKRRSFGSQRCHKDCEYIYICICMYACMGVCVYVCEEEVIWVATQSQRL